MPEIKIFNIEKKLNFKTINIIIVAIIKGKMLWEILEPVNKNKRGFFDKVVESVKEPRVLWYPSAGNDYRDILEFSEISLEDLGISSDITDGKEILHEINRKNNCNFTRLTIAYDYNIKKEELPNLFIHTDYHKNLTPEEGVVFDDGKTKVTIKELCELKIKKDIDIKYNVNKSYAFVELAYKKPKIYLLDVELCSDVLGKINKPLIYFMFENINFLEEVLIKQKIEVPYILKVRDGYGSKGWGKISMAVIYAFLPILNTKYLICDYYTMEKDRLKTLIEEIASRLNLDLEKLNYYKLERLSPKDIIWSSYLVNVYEVKIIKEKKFEIELFLKEIIEFLESKELNRYMRNFNYYEQ